MTRKDIRERVLAAAMDAIAERGMVSLRMEDVGRRVGMSPGHILYYYRSKQQLLLETLRWSEDGLARRRADELPALPTALERLERFVALYLPGSARQADWLLWLQVWALASEDSEVAAVANAQQERWASDLAAIVEHGRVGEEFSSDDPRGFAQEFLAVLRGLSLHILNNGPVLDRARAAVVAMELAGLRLGFATPGERPAARRAARRP